MVLAWVRCYVVVVLNASFLIGDAVASSFPRSPRIPTIEMREFFPHSISLVSFCPVWLNCLRPFVVWLEIRVKPTGDVNQVRHRGWHFTTRPSFFLARRGCQAFFSRGAAEANPGVADIPVIHPTNSLRSSARTPSQGPEGLLELKDKPLRGFANGDVCGSSGIYRSGRRPRLPRPGGTF